jgi:retron-type reverse transcriptase
LTRLQTFKNRVLQQIVALGVQPIRESQADSLSFGFSLQRNVTQAIAFVNSKLSESRITQSMLRFDPVKVEKKQYDSFSGKKSKFQNRKTSGNTKRKRNQRYKYAYWIYIDVGKTHCKVSFNLRHTDRHCFFLVLSLEACYRYVWSCLDMKSITSSVLHQQWV